MADANKTLITRAEVTSIITPASGRFALVMDGQTIELGDTGLRDLSGQMQNVAAPAAGMLVAGRQGRTVIVKVSATPSTSGNITITATGIGTTLAPKTTLWQAGRGGPIGISTNGHIYINPAVAGTKVDATLTFITDAAWPTTLPGVKLGDPVVI